MDERQSRILQVLDETYGHIGPGLDFTNPFECLISTILSAQTTDVRVNMVTPALFEVYSTPEAMLELEQKELEKMIASIGLYRNKAKHILGTCRILVEEHEGQVPGDRVALEKLPGVGRKTASVVLCNAFETPAFAVDTHVHRVSNRLGLAHSNTVEGTERDLTELLPAERWCHDHHLFIWHGRKICLARSPLCQECMVSEDCPAYNNWDN